MNSTFTCRDCGNQFTLAASVSARYPNWTPAQCMSCRKGPRSAPRTTEAALTAYTAGPQDGIFTDGGCDPNPGPGGWGAVKVIDGEITDERHGHAPNTTNNQMELRALIEAFKMAGPDEEIAVYSDSQYCVSTINIWG